MVTEEGGAEGMQKEKGSRERGKKYNRGEIIDKEEVQKSGCWLFQLCANASFFQFIAKKLLDFKT